MRSPGEDPTITSAAAAAEELQEMRYVAHLLKRNLFLLAKGNLLQILTCQTKSDSCVIIGKLFLRTGVFYLANIKGNNSIYFNTFLKLQRLGSILRSH